MRELSKEKGLRRLETAAVAVAVALFTGVEEWLLVPVAFVLYLGRGIIWQLVEFFGRAGALGG